MALSTTCHVCVQLSRVCSLISYHMGTSNYLCNSSAESIKTQGSVLGPLLFIIYTYDIKFLCPNDKVIMYADDTTLVISGRNYTEAVQKSNAILERFVHYFYLNKLSINPEKSKFIRFQPKKKTKKESNNAAVTMNNMQIEEVTSIKFLGVVLNKQLTWTNHKQYVQSKVSKSLGILYNSRKVMTERETVLMYKTFIQSNLLYAIEVWGHTVTHDSEILRKKLRIRVLEFCLTQKGLQMHGKEVMGIYLRYLNCTNKQSLGSHQNTSVTNFHIILLTCACQIKFPHP